MLMHCTLHLIIIVRVSADMVIAVVKTLEREIYVCVGLTV